MLSKNYGLKYFFPQIHIYTSTDTWNIWQIFFILVFAFETTPSFWSFYAKMKRKTFLKFHSPWNFSYLGFSGCFLVLFGWFFLGFFFFFCLIVPINYLHSCILHVYLNANHKTHSRGLCCICQQLFLCYFIVWKFENSLCLGEDIWLNSVVTDLEIQTKVHIQTIQVK